jgi:hypothetical protein
MKSGLEAARLTCSGDLVFYGFRAPHGPPGMTPGRCYGLLPLIAVMQVHHRGASCRMPHPVHELTQIGALIGRKLITGMAQVVKVKFRKTRRAKRWQPDAPIEIAVP